jgi:hypothetical protein
MRKPLRRLSRLVFAAFWLKRSISLREWGKRGFEAPSPYWMKRGFLAHQALPAPWVETGTYMGDTTQWLAKRFSYVVSLEPDEMLFKKASIRLGNRENIRLLNETSEEGLAHAIDLLDSTAVNFWLDGHFSSGSTYQGTQDTPIHYELHTISEFLNSKRLTEVAVFIDDVRLFVTQHRERPGDTSREGYPSLYSLCSWAENQGLVWTIEHDIFMARSPAE